MPDVSGIPGSLCATHSAGPSRWNPPDPGAPFSRLRATPGCPPIWALDPCAPPVMGRGRASHHEDPGLLPVTIGVPSAPGVRGAQLGLTLVPSRTGWSSLCPTSCQPEGSAVQPHLTPEVGSQLLPGHPRDLLWGEEVGDWGLYTAPNPLPGKARAWRSSFPSVCYTEQSRSGNAASEEWSDARQGISNALPLGPPTPSS